MSLTKIAAVKSRKRRFSTGDGVYEGDGYSGVENGMGGGAGYQGEGEYGPGSGSTYGGEGEYGPDGATPEDTYSGPGTISNTAGYAQRQGVGGLSADGYARNEFGQMVDKMGVPTGLLGAAVATIARALDKTTDAGYSHPDFAPGGKYEGQGNQRGASDRGEVEHREIEGNPYGPDAPTVTTKLDDPQASGTGRREYVWDAATGTYRLRNLGAQANPMGYREGQEFRMRAAAQGGLAAANRMYARGGVPGGRRFAAGGTMAEAFLNGENTPGNVRPLNADELAQVKAYAVTLSKASGRSPEEELVRYALAQQAEKGGTMADMDTWMGYPAGTSQWWANKFAAEAGTGNTNTGTTNTGTTNTGTTNTGTVTFEGGISGLDGYVDPYTTPLPDTGTTNTGTTNTGTVTFEGGISGLDGYVDPYTTPLPDLNEYNTLYPTTPDPGTVTPDPGTVTPDPGTVTPDPVPVDPYGGLNPLDPTQWGAVVTEANRLAGLSGRTPGRELYNFATQKSGLNHGQIDRMMGFEPGYTDAWWAQQAGAGKDALANGGGGYGGGGSNFNNGGPDGTGVRQADGTRKLLGGVNDNAYDARQYGWNQGIQAAQPARTTPYVRGMAAGGIAAGAPASGRPAQLQSRYIDAAGTGLSDDKKVVMDDGKPGFLADGEFVVSSDVVSGLGGGSSKAGAKMLYDMMERVRQQAHGSKKQIRPVDPKQVLPA